MRRNTRCGRKITALERSHVFLIYFLSGRTRFVLIPKVAAKAVGGKDGTTELQTRLLRTKYVPVVAVLGAAAAV